MLDVQQTPARASQRRLQWLLEKSSSQPDGPPSKMAEDVKLAQQFQAENIPAGARALDVGRAQDAAWQKRWAEVMAQAAEAASQPLAGCERVLTGTCRYSLRSVFLLHRGFGLEPKSVNTVGILTDTIHAVSCGDDARCWVWNIASGAPRQVFLDHGGPVQTVSVLTDGAFVLSAGLGKDGKSGEAFVWWWEKGITANTIACGASSVAGKPGPFLSSAAMPAWRLALVGCANNYTFMWNWDTNVFFELPWHARTADQVNAALQTQFNNWKAQTFNGLQRVAAQNFQDDVQAFQKFASVAFPAQAALQANITKGLNSIYDSLHANRMGAVTAMAYVPTNLRFATGHADGKVRYWNADSGNLLRSMGRHDGPILAIAASPKKQQAFSGGADGTVRLWDLPSARQILVFYQPCGGPVRSLVVMPGGTRIAVGSDDGFVRIWDANTGLLLCGFNTFGGAVNGLAVNPGNPTGQLITANADGYVRVFNPRVIGQV